jgi:hypothetical protein
MNAIQLFNEHGAATSIWYCENCRSVHKDQEEAEKCCKAWKCKTCGAEVRRYWTICDRCRLARHEATKAARWEKAETVDPGTVDMFYIEDFDEYTREPEEWAEDHEDEPVLSELRVYACERINPETDASWVVEDALSDVYDGAYEDVGSEETEKLQEFLNQWWRDTGIHWYEPDYSRKVVFPLKEG